MGEEGKECTELLPSDDMEGLLQCVLKSGACHGRYQRARVRSVGWGGYARPDENGSTDHPVT